MATMSESQLQNVFSELEMEMVNDMATRMSNSCRKKCISNYNEGDLTKGEGVCLDRCVAKYMELFNRSGEIFNKKSKESEAELKKAQESKRIVA